MGRRVFVSHEDVHAAVGALQGLDAEGRVLRTHTGAGQRGEDHIPGKSALSSLISFVGLVLLALQTCKKSSLIILPLIPVGIREGQVHA